jgi:hypothetical protein
MPPLGERPAVPVSGPILLSRHALAIEADDGDHDNPIRRRTGGYTCGITSALVAVEHASHK